MQPTKKTPLAGAIALVLAGVLPAAANAEWIARGDLEVVQSSLFYNRVQQAWFVEARLSNSGTNALTGPLRILVESASLPVVGADGTDSGLPYFEVDVDGPGLAPGETTAPVRILLQRAGRVRPQLSLAGQIDDEPFQLQLLHVADIDSTGATAALENVKGFSAFLDAFRADPSFPNSITLSSGDNWIPGPRHSVADDDRMASLLGVPGVGRGDAALLNAMGFQASALGNHELDQGTSAFVDIIGVDKSWPGAQFPYLSTNLDFTADSNTAPRVVADGLDAGSIPNSLAGWATVDVNGETIGVVGATTPSLGNITSPGNIGIYPIDFDAADPADLDALAAEIQPAVDALTARGINKVILLAHMQQIAIEQALAERLADVDIIIAGGSNTLLADANDVLWPGDVAAGTYPIALTSADGEPVLIVNTDGDYKYLGRLVSDFSVDGLIDLASLDDSVNGVYATTDTRLAVFGLSTANADPTVAALADQMLAIVLEKDFNILGLSEVYLDGRRGTVRTEESNLGNLTADANLWMARQADHTVVVSIKNGGGIRSRIGDELVPPGSTDPSEVELRPREGNLVSQLDVQSALSFNNGLTLLTLTAAELVAVIEHGVAASDGTNTQGRFPQVGGIRFSWDLTQPPGSRVQTLAIVDDSGAVVDVVVDGGVLVGDPDRTFRTVTLDFLAGDPAKSPPPGGDGYPFPQTDRVDLVGSGLLPDGIFTFAAPGSEQSALAEYLGTFFAEVPFDLPETAPIDDLRIQNLAVAGKADTVLDIPPGALNLVKIGGLQLGGAEIVNYDPDQQRLYVAGAPDATGKQVHIVDFSDPHNLDDGDVLASLDPKTDVANDVTGFIGGDVTSVGYKNGLLAAAVAADPKTDQGYVAFYDANGVFLGSHPAGALPDMLAWDNAGNRVVVANEGEPGGGVDPEGSVTVIDVPSVGDAAARVAGASVYQLDFRRFNGQEADLRLDGVRIFPDVDAANDFEPEYVAFAADDSKAFIAMQEANTLAVVNLSSPPYAIELDLIPLGTKDHSRLENALDASDRDGGINIQPWPVRGMYMPDGIATYDPGLGRTFVLTANEGDARNEDARIKNVVLDPTVLWDPAELQQDANLGRLDVSTIDGLNADGEHEALFSYGARSFSIWDVEMGTMADSNDDFARVTAQQTPTLFNANKGDPAKLDGRSDNKGAEPESVIVGVVDGRPYAFIGLERAGGGVMVYDVRNPHLPRFVSYTPGAPAGDISVEGTAFVSVAQSPTGTPLFVTANEVSQTIAVYEVQGSAPPPDSE
jgi:2',3'-cyclic-nucleotide 2'-phosphodiesterase / 3'-nucleotidase / 5'-nucleotidase